MPAAPPQSTSAKAAARFPGRVEAWLAAHLDGLAAGIVGIGLSLRLVAASAFWLNADEAIHFMVAKLPTLFEVGRAAMVTNAHPPLVFLLLHLWLGLGRSELFMRLPSTAAAAVSLWLVYRWVGRTVGKTEGLIALLLLCFSLNCILVSVEVRQYGLLLLLTSAALYGLERAFAEKSPRWLILFGGSLGLAILTHYAVAWFALATGIYALARIARRELPARLAGLWAASQVLAVGLYTALYRLQLTRLRSGGSKREAVEGWLRHEFFESGRDSVIPFLYRSTKALFAYLLSWPPGGRIGLALFLIGVGGLCWARKQDGPAKARSRLFGLFLVLPFLAAAGGALLGIIPYGGTRHMVILFPFAVAGIGHGLALLCGRRIWPVALAAMVAVPLWLGGAVRTAWQVELEPQLRGRMEAAVNCLRRQAPAGGILFVDQQTSLCLGYYLGGDRAMPMGVNADRERRRMVLREGLAVDPFERLAAAPDVNRPAGSWTPDPMFFAPQKHFIEFPLGGYRVISSRDWSWDAALFEREFSRMRQAYGLDPAAPVWVVDAGWGANLIDWAGEKYPGQPFPYLRAFGRRITLGQVPGGIRLPTEDPVRQALAELEEAVARQGRPPADTLFWPSGFPPAPRLLSPDSPLAGHVMTYRELYRTMTRGGGLNGHLPGLAFFVFDTPERHIRMMRQMNRRESFFTPDYAVTLLAVDSANRAGAFDIRPRD